MRRTRDARGFTLIDSPGGSPLSGGLSSARPPDPQVVLAVSDSVDVGVAPQTPLRPPKRRGFTLIELLVVMAIIGILASIGIPMLLSTPIKAKEAALKENLFTFRSCLDQYKADKGRYPEALEVLVQENYIRKVPVDPFTKSADTWELVFEEPSSAEAASEEPPGIIDVRSGSTEIALDGTPYNTW
jgi:general secretion pathway protein G